MAQEQVILDIKGTITYEEMRAKLKQMIKAYDNMSAEERKAADKGGALLQQIQDQTKAIQEAEMACGRYSKSLSAAYGEWATGEAIYQYLND